MTKETRWTPKEGGKSGRSLKVRVRSAKGRTTSSQRWLDRQLNDPYVAAAKSKGYRSRAAFKLAEIDDQHGFLKAGGSVIDLGAAPGGWTQVALERVGKKGKVVAVDIHEVTPIPGAVVMQMDFLASDAGGRIREAIDGAADVVLSDMAAPATGHTQTDHIRIMALCQAAFDFARQVLRPGGAFLAKVLRGGTERDLLSEIKRSFRRVEHVKPPSSRADSAEMYILARDFHGARASRPQS
jgi:23S rRNA (uridine2552-2'-O)-methyltransferase